MENRFLFSVSELTKHIKDCIEPIYMDIWVEGEISNMRTPSSGHCYLTLKDERSQLKAVMFRMRNRALKFAAQDGLKVVCRGRITIYEPRGEYQIIIEEMLPKGIGELQLAFEQLKSKLQKEGLFDSQAKKSIPSFPEKIAVITSPTGAAVRDIIQIISRRFPGVEIIVVPAMVQGQNAADEISEAIKIVNAMDIADVIILARGGGSLEDLCAFNTETVARAIFNSQIPLISAVGHEIDFTIADFVADLRAPTPSGAAELAVKEKKEIADRISSHASNLYSLILQRLERSSNSLKFLNSHIHNPERIITDLHMKHDELCMRLIQNMPKIIKHKKIFAENLQKNILSTNPLTHITNKKTRVEHLAKFTTNLLDTLKAEKRARLQNAVGKLNSLSPLNVLERGYSIAKHIPAMTIVKDSGVLKEGDQLNIKFKKGEAYCRVEKICS